MVSDSKPKPKQPTMFDKLGGRSAIEAVVDLFYGKVFADDEVSRFFEGINKQRLKAHQVLLPACDRPVWQLTSPRAETLCNCTHKPTILVCPSL